VAVRFRAIISFAKTAFIIFFLFQEFNAGEKANHSAACFTFAPI